AEVRKAHGHGDGAKRLKPRAAASLEHALREMAGALQDDARLERVVLEGLLLADRLRFPLVRHRAVGDAARLAVKRLAPLAEPLDQALRVDRAKIADQ